MEKRLVINADDFGLCEGVNRAVAKAHTEGILTSATIMTNMPAAEQAVRTAKELATLGVGVHLNLTSGRPLSQHPALGFILDSEGFFSGSTAKLYLLSVVVPKFRAAIRAELAAQIQWAIDRGIKPTHLDSHKHFHIFPLLFSIVCQLARRFQIRAIRFAFEPKQVCAMPWPLPPFGGKERARIIRPMARINMLQNRDYFKTDALLGVAHTGKIDVNFLRAVALYNSAETAELLTHPGFIDGLDPSQTRLVQSRRAELDVLCSQETKQSFKNRAVKLVHYGQL